MYTGLDSSVIRQNGQSQNGGDKQAKHAKFSENEHFLPPDAETYVSVSGGKKCSFFEKFTCLAFFRVRIRE